MKVANQVTAAEMGEQDQALQEQSDKVARRPRTAEREEVE